jgi:hypothetical protein
LSCKDRRSFHHTTINNVLDSIFDCSHVLGSVLSGIGGYYTTQIIYFANSSGGLYERKDRGKCKDRGMTIVPQQTTGI